MAGPEPVHGSSSGSNVASACSSEVEVTNGGLAGVRPDGLSAGLLQDAGAVDQPLSSDESSLRTTVVAASLCNFCLGYNTGVVAGAILNIKVDPLFAPLGSVAQGILVSCILAGGALGAASGSLAERIGRRKTLLVLAVLYAVSPVAMALAPSIYVLVAARFVAGIATGMSSVLVNVYISEVSPAESRGRLGGMSPFLGTTGILVAYVTSAGLGALPFVWNWRIQLGLAALPALLILLLRRRLPETPCWLLTRGRRADARESLRMLFPAAAPNVTEGELDRLETELAAAQARGSEGVTALCFRHRWPTLIGVSVNVLQQISGINVVIYFGPTILNDAGFNNTAAMVATAGVSVVQLFATGVLMQYVDRFGRRPLALIGLIGMVLGFGLLIACFAIKAMSSAGDALAVGFLAVAGMLVFRAAFSLSLGPLPYIMTAEFFPQEARAAGVALSWTTNWAANFAVSLSFPVCASAFPGSAGIAKILSVYVIFCLAAFVFVWKFLPETRGLRLEAAAAQRSPGSFVNPMSRSASQVSVLARCV